MNSGSVGRMRWIVETLGRRPALRAPFFGLGLFSVRLVYPLQFLILRDLMDCGSVLDLGCGRHSMVPIIPKSIHTTGVEWFREHYEEAKRSGRHTRYLHADITQVDFEGKSFDAVVMLDVLEHLDKEAGERLLAKMERWARKKIVIFTPNGFVHQEEFANNPLMAHRSGWTAPELRRLGYRVRGVRGFKCLKSDHVHVDDPDGHAQTHESWMDRLVDLTQIWTYAFPESAFQLYAVKRLDDARQK
jgi:cyclopropane fatty-acyl-phospholipid synthase-like methyltransferase